MTKGFTLYGNGQNKQTICGIPFTVTSQEIRDGEGKSVTLTNTYTRETVTLTAIKQWTGPSGSPIAWPLGKTVVFELGTLDEIGQFTAVSEVQPITLDNKKDDNGEELPGYAVFKNVPKYQVIDGENGTKTLEEIRYAARENGTVTGYYLVYPAGATDYVAFGAGTSVKIRNQMEATSASFSKAWDKNIIPQGATATFRLYSYTGDDPKQAVWASNVNDITLDGTPDEGDDAFGEKTAWQADFTGLPKYDNSGQELNYIVREIACTPVRYEAMQEYAANGGTITNRPAAVDFTVTKAWSGTPGDAWPENVRITFRLLRKTKAGVEDTNFSADYVLSANAIMSQESVKDNYGESRSLGAWSADTHTLTVSSLPKYDESGNQWLYYVTETKIEKKQDNEAYKDVSDSYYKEYRDKNHYKVSGGFTYSGGSVTNALTSITISKTVTGNMGDKNKEFSFTLKLTNNGADFDGQEIECQKGTQSTYVNFTNGEVTFTLKHGERIKFLDLPRNLSYTVTETDEDAAGYKTTYTLNGWDEQEGRTASGENLENNPVLAFVNRKDVIIPTGISSNTPAWVCMAWLSWILPLSLWVYRRRNIGGYTVNKRFHAAANLPFTKRLEAAIINES